MRVSKAQLQIIINEELENVIREDQLNEGLKSDLASLALAMAGLIAVGKITYDDFMNSPHFDDELKTAVEMMDLDQSADTDIPIEDEEIEFDFDDE